MVTKQWIRRADIVTVLGDPDAVGGEMRKTRYGVIISSAKGCRLSDVLNVVYCTCQGKDSPLYVQVRDGSWAKCETVYAVSRERVVKKIGHADDRTMSRIMKGVAKALGM